MTWRKCGLICALLWLPIIGIATKSMLQSLGSGYAAKAECPSPSEGPCVAPTIICDGVTDNAPAIRAAIDELVAVDGGVVMLPQCDKLVIGSQLF